VAVVTGGSRGIGAATVSALRAAGATVIAVARPPFGDTPSGDVGIHRVGADVTEWSAVRDALGGAIERTGPVDILVNAAGIAGVRAPIWELDVEQMQSSIAVNLLAAFYTMKVVLPVMADRSQGVVVNIVSGAAHRPRAGRAMYGTAKSALEHLTQVAAAEVTEAGVRVYAFHPGQVDTELYRASRRSGAGLRELEAAQRSGELQQPVEPAAAIAFLASDDAVDVTDVVVPWRDRAYRDSLRSRADFIDRIESSR
jgi:NAD(P)-dependent dehydrogenase (short-subunit alcohol dehydrogenase family)